MRPAGAIFCAVFLLCVLCGCGHTECVLSGMESLSGYDRCPTPVKFYVDEIEILHADRKNRFFKSGEEEKWRAGLLKYYPAIFAPSPKDALPVTITMVPEYFGKNRSPASAVTMVFLSFLTLGIIPVYSEFTTGVGVIVRVKDEPDCRYQDRWEASCRARGNVGIVGIILPTRYLLPRLPEKHFENYSLNSMSDNTVCDDRLKEFLGVFVAAVHRLPEDKIQKLYLSRKTKEVTLLE